eukprot:NODE_8321_length_389_cov_2.398204.p4 GENE.NODE_8321_length_389_cov_2.398204~~NODE_8321_length_389_cov_2.398204.p4  ORF type:complete len:61 (+),score=10.32 NODE_8321_length_389_cov_2.398204:123-305(+)
MNAGTQVTAVRQARPQNLMYSLGLKVTSHAMTTTGLTGESPFGANFMIQVNAVVACFHCQ